MKRNLKLIALAAAALITACGSSESTEQQAAAAAAVVVEKPKVKIDTVRIEQVDQLERYSTTVEAEVKNNIIPNSPLRIEKILVEVGDKVRKGQELVMLDASNLDQMKLQYENQLIDFNRVEELYKVRGVSKAEYDNAKTQLEVVKKQIDSKMENTVLKSPIDGVVSTRNYDNGDMYGGQPILVIEQISPVKMKINISESRYAQTVKGLKATVKLNAYENEEFQGVIDLIYPTINSATHTFPVEIKVDNKDLRVRPGMFGEVTLNFGTAEHVVVPDAAVIKQAGSGDYYVFTYVNGLAKSNKVELGRRFGNRYEILSGLNDKDLVIVAGHTGLSNDTEVEVIE